MIVGTVTYINESFGYQYIYIEKKMRRARVLCYMTKYIAFKIIREYRGPCLVLSDIFKVDLVMPFLMLLVCIFSPLTAHSGYKGFL